MRKLYLYQRYTRVVSRFLSASLMALLGGASSGLAADGIVHSAAYSDGYYDPKVQGAKEPFPGYAEECGFKIFLKPSRQVALAERSDDGTMVIFIDPLLTKPENEFHKAFLIAHECAHHRLGHTSEDGLALRLKSRRMVTDQELSADCLAAELLARAGLTNFTKTMSTRMGRAGIFSPGGGYPAGVQRAKIIRRCGAVGERHYLAQTAEMSVKE